MLTSGETYYGRLDILDLSNLPPFSVALHSITVGPMDDLFKVQEIVLESRLWPLLRHLASWILGFCCHMHDPKLGCCAAYTWHGVH